MKLIPNSVTRSVGRSVLQTKKNSPHIFFGLGVVGIIGSAVLACKATLKLEENLDDTKKELDEIKEVGVSSLKGDLEYSEHEYYRDLGYGYSKGIIRLGKLYGPSVIVGGVSIALLTGSHVQLTRRNAALAVTLGAVSRAYEEYRIRMQDELGKDREREIYHDVQDGEIENNGKKEKIKMVDPLGLSPYARFFEETNISWQNDMEMNRLFIQCQQNYANHLLKARGHVFLNDVYDSLGFDRTPAGAVVGWVINGKGDGYIDFGLYDVPNMNFINGNARGALLDFNVDGVIYDQI